MANNKNKNNVKKNNTKNNSKVTKKVEVKKEEIKEEENQEIEEIKEDDNLLKKVTKERIMMFLSGLFVGLLCMIIFYPDRIAELENGEQVAVKVGKSDITANDLYSTLKDETVLNKLLEIIDKTILEKKYELDDEDLKSIEETANSYIEHYVNEGYTKEQFFSEYGFESDEDFQKYLQLDYRRNLYYQDYLDKSISDEDIDKFYENSVYGTIKTEHILVKSTHSNAEEKATEILNKLKNGSSWNDLKTEYASDIVTEEVSVQFDSPLEETYKTEAVNLKDGTFSSSLVKTSYGYHIVYRISTLEKADKKDLKDRIKTVLKNKMQTEDSNLYQKVMIKMREEEKVEIKDTEIKKVYDTYVKLFDK